MDEESNGNVNSQPETGNKNISRHRPSMSTSSSSGGREHKNQFIGARHRRDVALHEPSILHEIGHEISSENSGGYFIDTNNGTSILNSQKEVLSDDKTHSYNIKKEILSIPHNVKKGKLEEDRKTYISREEDFYQRIGLQQYLLNGGISEHVLFNGVSSYNSRKQKDMSFSSSQNELSSNPISVKKKNTLQNLYQNDEVFNKIEKKINSSQRDQKSSYNYSSALPINEKSQVYNKLYIKEIADRKEPKNDNSVVRKIRDQPKGWYYNSHDDTLDEPSEIILLNSSEKPLNKKKTNDEMFYKKKVLETENISSPPSNPRDDKKINLPSGEFNISNHSSQNNIFINFPDNSNEKHVNYVVNLTISANNNMKNSSENNTLYVVSLSLPSNNVDLPLNKIVPQPPEIVTPPPVTPNSVTPSSKVYGHYSGGVCECSCPCLDNPKKDAESFLNDITGIYSNESADEDYGIYNEEATEKRLIESLDKISVFTNTTASFLSNETDQEYDFFSSIQNVSERYTSTENLNTVIFDENTSDYYISSESYGDLTTSEESIISTTIQPFTETQTEETESSDVATELVSEGSEKYPYETSIATTSGTDSACLDVSQAPPVILFFEGEEIFSFILLVLHRYLIFFLVF